MSHPPIGDRGQRYEVRATGYPNAGACVIGWTVDRTHAIKMAEAILEAPSCTASDVCIANIRQVLST